MRKVAFLGFFFVPLVAGQADAQEWVKRMFTTSRHDFGTIAKGAKAEFEFPFSNVYMEDLHIQSIHVSCTCTSVRLKNNKKWYKTYEKGAIIAHINSSTFEGSKGATITVKFDRPFRGEMQLHAQVYIRNDVVLNPGSAQLGSVYQGTPVQKDIIISSPSNPNLRIVDVRSANPHLTGKLYSARRGSRDYQLRVSLDKNAPAGYVRDHLILVTNDRRRTQIPVLVEGYVHSAISISPSSLMMGVVKPGEKVSKKLIVRANEPFVIKNITSGIEGMQFDTSKEQAPKQLHVIPVTFVGGDEPGNLVQAIRIETDNQNLKGQLLAQVTVVGPDGQLPSATVAKSPSTQPATGTPATLQPNPSAIAMPAPTTTPALTMPAPTTPAPRSPISGSTAIATNPAQLPVPQAHPPVGLVRPDPNENLPERPILSRFPRLKRLVEERETAQRGQLGTPTPADPRARRGSELTTPTFRNEAQRRRYEELLRRNGPSPADRRRW